MSGGKAIRSRWADQVQHLAEEEDIADGGNERGTEVGQRNCGKRGFIHSQRQRLAKSIEAWNHRVVSRGGG